MGTAARGLKARLKSGNQRLQSNVKKKFFFDPSLIETDRALIGEDFPKALTHAGLRICTFTKVVARLSYLLVQNFDVPRLVTVSNL